MADEKENWLKQLGTRPESVTRWGLQWLSSSPTPPPPNPNPVPNKAKKKSSLPSYLSEAEFMALIKVTKNRHHKLAFLLGFAAGLRIGEIVRLQRANIDLEKHRIIVKAGKGNKDRIVPLPKNFQQNYLAYIPIPCGKRALEIAFKNSLRKASITRPGLRFHSLRHSFAIECMQKHIPLNAIQLLMGHENIRTTSIYLKLNPEDALKAYEDLW